nr:MAG TPA: hypothetical protein [Bacteriophage sp.]
MSHSGNNFLNILLSPSIVYEVFSFKEFYNLIA